MLRFDVDVRASDSEKRTISGVAVPFNKTASLNGTTYSFKRGSLAKGRSITPLLLDHDTSKPVGVLVDLSDGEDGSIATFRVDPTPEGDAALATAASGSRGGLSVGVNVIDADDVEGVQHVASASLMEISLCAIPAFEDAQVTTVTASEDAPNDPIRGESDNPESAKEVEMEAPTPEVEEKTEVVVQASAPAPVSMTVGEYVAASVAAMRGDRQAADVLAALDTQLTPDSPGVIPEVFTNQILDRTTNLRTLYSVVSKRALPGDGKEIISPREDPIHGYSGWRAWDSGAATQKMTIGTKTTQVAPWSYALAVHQDVQNRSIINFIEYAYGRMADQYFGNVEIEIADAIKSGAHFASTTMAEAVNDVWTAGRAYGFAPSLILATPDYWQHLVEAEGVMKYSSGSASAQPYAGSIAGMSIVVSPLLDTNYVINPNAFTWMESESFRLSAANVSALELEIAMTRYTASTMNFNPQVADSGGKNPGDVDYVPTYDDTKSLALASFPTP